MGDVFLGDIGVVHNDIKAENILLRCDWACAAGGAGAPTMVARAVLADFSKAARLPARLARTTGCIEAPEIVRADAAADAGADAEHGSWCDVWSIGLLVDHVVCGSRAFSRGRELREAWGDYPDSFAGVVCDRVSASALRRYGVRDVACELSAIVRDCLRLQGHLRPSPTALCARLLACAQPAAVCTRHRAPP